MGAPPDSDGSAIRGYEPVHRIAQSYLGTLWIALNKQLDPEGELALLRRVHLPPKTPGDARQGILRAGRDARDLEHDNILSVIEVLEEGEEIAFAYEHVEAEPLRSLQSWANLRCLSFPLGVSLRITVDLLLGVEALHRTHVASPTRAVFGGLSPDSVLLARDGRTRLSDPLLSACTALLEGIGFNTAKLAYAAPEQVHAVAPLTPQCDLFTCGAMLWELLTTRRLLAGSRSAIERRLLEHDLPSLTSHARGENSVSASLAQTIESALSADPAKRPASAAEMAEQLERCGHPVASREDVAQFVGKLSGQRFDRRSAAVRSKSLPQLDAPLEWPIELPTRNAGTRRGARAHPTPGEVLTPRAGPERPAATLPTAPSAGPAQPGPSTHERPSQAPLAQLLFAPAPKPSAPAAPREPTPPAAPFAALPTFGRPRERQPTPAPPGIVASQRPAAPTRSTASEATSWDTVLAPVASIPAAPRVGFGRTMSGLGAPTHPALAPTMPFVNLTPSPFLAAQTAPPGASPGSSAARESALGAPASSRHSAAPPAPRSEPGPSSLERQISSRPTATRIGFALPPFEPQAPPRRPARAGWADRLLPRRGPPRLVAVGVALIGVVAALGVVLFLRSQRSRPSATLEAEPAALATLPTRTSPDSERSAELGSSKLDSPAPPAQPDEPPHVEPTDAPAAQLPTVPRAADATQPLTDATGDEPPRPKPLGKDFDAAKLDDSQLVELFALERRRDLPSCEQRLNAKAGEYSGHAPARSRTQLKAARRELMRGKSETAFGYLCGAVAYDADNVEALRSLAELALQLGDPPRAKQAVEQALQRAPKDAELLALEGDVMALLGDIPGSRHSWLANVPARGSESERARRLAASYRRMGARSLDTSSFARALAYYRRALILTDGRVGASVGLSEALLWLEHGQAALAWIERAARALPRDSHVRLLLGDAYAANGQPESAQVAWQKALELKPSSAIAARRLSRGKR